MREGGEAPPVEETETVSYVLPKRLAKAVARHAVEADLRYKSAAAADLIERGLNSLSANEPSIVAEVAS